ncbi:MAG: hypothetical protein ABI671_14120 [Burkholderiales bacterium]
MQVPYLNPQKKVLFKRLITPSHVAGDDPAYDYEVLKLAQAVLTEAQTVIDEIERPDNAGAEVEPAAPSIVGAFISSIDKRMIVMSTGNPRAVKSAHKPLTLDPHTDENYALQSWRVFTTEKASGVRTDYKIPETQRAMYEQVYVSGIAPEFRVLAEGVMTRSERRDRRNTETEKLLALGYVIATTSWN